MKPVQQPKHPVLGILGGLGPMSTVYFYEMLTRHTVAHCDQDHLDIVISSRATTPDRTAYILGQSHEDPFAVMEQDARMLVEYGATLLAIPCNTAHYFYDRLNESIHVPILNMVEQTVLEAKRRGCRKVGLLATTGTICTHTYARACEKHGLAWAAPDEAGQADIMDVIYGDIKQGRRADMAKFGSVVRRLQAEGCERMILGCTELSLVKKEEHLNAMYIDSMEVLAKNAIETFGRTPIGFEEE